MAKGFLNGKSLIWNPSFPNFANITTAYICKWEETDSEPNYAIQMGDGIPRIESCRLVASGTVAVDQP